MASANSDMSRAGGQSSSEVEDLRRENERLGRELDEAVAERNQSAQYGLGLLEETKSLKQRCEQLETLYENTRHELDITQEVPVMPILCYCQY